MLHPNGKRRISDIVKMADLFNGKGYDKTSNAILSFIDIMTKDTIPPDFLKRLNWLFGLFEKEFVGHLPVGKGYRRRCFEEIREIVLEALDRMHPEFNQALLVLYPLLKRLNKAEKITGAIAEALNSGRVKNKNVIFHLYCYAYLILIEGIFDELARILYFLTVASKTSIPSQKDLDRLRVWNVLGKLASTPVFLERWQEKNHIRNAIGHARADYDPLKNQVRFIDIDEKKGTITYDSGNIPLSKFNRMALELEDSVNAFLYTMILLRIYDLIISKDPY